MRKKIASVLINILNINVLDSTVLGCSFKVLPVNICMHRRCSDLFLKQENMCTFSQNYTVGTKTMSFTKIISSITHSLPQPAFHTRLEQLWSPPSDRLRPHLPHSYCCWGDCFRQCRPTPAGDGRENSPVSVHSCGWHGPEYGQ